MADKIIKNKDGSFGGIKRKRLIKRKQGSLSNPIEDKKIKEKVRLKAPKKRIGVIGKKPVFGDVTQGFKDTVQSVIDEGGSPKLTTTEARVDRITDKLTKAAPKLALRGGGRAYGKNS